MNPATSPSPAKLAPAAAASSSGKEALLDAPLIALTNQCGGDLTQVLQAFFSFLHRRTDFYLIPNEEDLKAGRAKMGFQQGYAEKVLLASFRQFPLRRLPKVATTGNRNGGGSSSSSSSTVPASASVGAAVASAKKESTPSSSTPSLQAQASSSTPSPSSSADTITTMPKTRHSEAVATADDDNTSAVRLTDDGLQVPVGNGGSTKRYKWTQTIEECSVLIRVPDNTRGKDLDVTIKSSSLAVKLKRDSSVLLDGSLTEKINPSESTWTMEGGVLVLVLDKVKKCFWSTVMEGDDKIDTTLVDNRRTISSYDEATQAQIRKIIFDQNQAKQGLPSSDEIVGNPPTVPETLPPGVEYINQEKIDKHHESNKK